MKIIFFINTLTAGGKERRLVELMKGLRSYSEIDFELVVMSDDIHYSEVYDLNVNIHKLIRNTKKDFSIFKRFYSICKSYRPDVIHCCDSMTAFYAVPTSKILNIRLVNAMVVNTPTRKNILNKHWLLGKITFLFSDKIVGNSQAGLNAYKVPRDKSTLIHNGFNFSRLPAPLSSDIGNQKNGDSNSIKIAMIATFSKLKDYKTYFKAAEILLGKGYPLTFYAIGKETDSPECISLVSEKFKEHFRFVGKTNEVESYIQQMDIGVLSTFTEGISNAILEFMAMSRPVVATCGGGTKEIVLDNLTGYLTKTSDPADLAEKLERLILNKELRVTFGKAANKHILENFSIDKMTKRYVAAYKELSPAD